MLIYDQSMSYLDARYARSSRCNSELLTQLITNLSNEVLGVLSLGLRLGTSEMESARYAHLHLLPEITTKRYERAKCSKCTVKSVTISSVRAVGLKHESNVSHQDFGASLTGL
jgi:hypothetical protein